MRVYPLTAPLFVNGENNRLTRFGVRYIVAHRVAEAAKVCPSLLTRKVSPHTWRHTTAMHLLQSNVDLSMIRSWHGHASIETTNTYIEIDLEMKRKTLAQTPPGMPGPRMMKGTRRPPSETVPLPPARGGLRPGEPWSVVKTT